MRAMTYYGFMHVMRAVVWFVMTAQQVECLSLPSYRLCVAQTYRGKIVLISSIPFIDMSCGAVINHVDLKVFHKQSQNLGGGISW